MSPQVPKSRTATTPFVPGLDFAPGEHVCAFYRGVGGRDEVLVPYLTEGLRAGQKCLAVVDESGRDDLLATLAREPGSATAQLDVRTLAEAFYGDERAGRFELTAALSEDPFITFGLVVRRPQELRVMLVNNRGERLEAKQAIRFA